MPRPHPGMGPRGQQRIARVDEEGEPRVAEVDRRAHAGGLGAQSEVCGPAHALSHVLSLEVLDMEPAEAKRLADKLNLSLATMPLAIQGSQVRAVVET